MFAHAGVPRLKTPLIQMNGFVLKSDQTVVFKTSYIKSDALSKAFYLTSVLYYVKTKTRPFLPYDFTAELVTVQPVHAGRGNKCSAMRLLLWTET